MIRTMDEKLAIPYESSPPRKTGVIAAYRRVPLYLKILVGTGALPGA